MLKRLFSTQEPRCRHRHTEKTHPKCFLDGKPIEAKGFPKILLFDIETAPIEALVWGLKQDYINPSNVVNDWFMLSWSARWLFADETFGDVLNSREAVTKNDYRIVKSLSELFEEADVVIGHNILGFDIPKLNTRLLYHNIQPPMYYQTVDTLRVARANFRITSNTLDYICSFLGLPGKEKVGLDVWKGCLRGDKASLRALLHYNKVDTLILEEVYVKLLPWIKNHPNVNLFSETDSVVCKNCGCSALEMSDKTYKTSVSEYQAFRCSKCKAPGRFNKSIKKARK